MKSTITAVVAVKPVPLAPLSAVLLAQFVAADAGSVEAKHDARLCAVYGAYRSALKDGNKTQLMLVESACATYATAKACRALTPTPDRASAAATRAAKVYGAYRLALDACGIPAVMKGATLDEVETRATAVAGEFVSIVSVALYDTPSDAQRAEKEAKAKAAKAEKEIKAKAAAKAADKALKAQVQQAAQQIAAANALTTEDIVRTAINAIRLGGVSPDLLAELSDVLDMVAVEVVTVPVTAEPASMTA